MSRISTLVCFVSVLAVLGLVIQNAPGPKNKRPAPLDLSRPVKHTAMRLPLRRARLARRAARNRVAVAVEAPQGVVCKDGVCRLAPLGSTTAQAAHPGPPETAGSAPPATNATPLAEIASLAPPTPEAADVSGPPAPDDAPPEPEATPAGPAALVWHTDYRKAMDEAVAQKKMLFIFFHDPVQTAARKAFETETLESPSIKQRLEERYVLAKLPRNAQIKIQGRPTRLLNHAAFSEMLGKQGIAILDLAHPTADYYGRAVSTFPFTPGKYYLTQATEIILDLPPGTLTQRTMIYAVRIHPERPASAYGNFTRVLADEAKQHSLYQASINVQGHHSWDSRFERINGKLPGGMMAQEVVAESWPNQTLVDACVECVHSWRRSPGHWGAVRSRQPLFGYDIKRGRNGIWYATGIFGRR